MLYLIIYRIDVAHTMRVEGRLSANGEPGRSDGGGGGAGGSILAYVQHFDGEGLYLHILFFLK
jgi:hypothetical protein